MPGSVAVWPASATMMKLRLGPGLVQVPGGHRRGHHVIAALDDDAGDGLQPVGVGQQLAVLLEEAAVDEVVAFDAGEGEGEVFLAEIADPLLSGSSDRVAPSHWLQARAQASCSAGSGPVRRR